MDILISIAAKIAEYTVAPIGRQAGYMIFCKDNLEKLKHSIKELEGKREQTKHSVEEERRNGREIEILVQSWLDRVDEITEQAKKLHEDPLHMNVGCSQWSFPNPRSRHQRSRNAKKMARSIAEMLGKGNFDRVGYLPPLDGVGLSFATRGSKNLKSRMVMKEDIILALKDPRVSKIGVYGLGGVGKTTLVNEVAKQVKDDKLFDAVIRVNVSQAPDLERIQAEIADLLGLHFEEKTIVGRACRLYKRIKEKTILIILDDVWVRIDLDKLGIPSENDQKGCKLLLISRNQDILQKMESEKDFRLDVLNDQETWSLFEAMAGDVVKDASLRSIAPKVAKKCAGLPVLVVTMARTLKNKDIYYWKDALNQLERVGNEEISEIAYSTLKFSYNWLGGEEVKTVFLLCGVLGTCSLVDNLLGYGFGLEIFKHINTMEDARNRLYKIISDLRASCLLLEDNTSVRVRMHDIVRDVAISIASRDYFVFAMKRNDKLEAWLIEDFLKRTTQIILNRCCIQKLPERLDCPNLKFLLLDSTDNHFLEIPHSFFEGMGNLRVLNLTGMIISSLPKSLSSLTNLKTLSFDQCALGIMVGIGALKNLEIVRCAHSSIEKFPNEIGQLNHLRRLDLKYSGIEVMPYNIISKLTKLEELCMSETSFKWEVEKQSKNACLSELRHLTNLTALEIQIRDARILPMDLMFEKLERYKIVIGDKWEQSYKDKFERYRIVLGDKWEQSYSDSASRLLKLKLHTRIHLEHRIKALIERAEDLYLDEINGISNVLYQLNGEGFPLLKSLHIQNNAEIQHIINSMEKSQTHVFFPILETLILHSLTNLEKICHGPSTANSFGKLRVIKVKSCEQLQYLFTLSMVKDLSQLLEIEVLDCNSIKTIVFLGSINGDVTIHKIEFLPLRSLTLQHLPAISNFCSDELTSTTLRTDIPTSFFNAEVTFPNLETLKLSSINLKKVWDDDQPSLLYSFQNLANLTMQDCGGLKYLFSTFMVESLKNLERLEISNCHMMEEIIATEGENSGPAMKEVRFPKLKRIKINEMENLKTVWHYQFEGLKILEVRKCEKLQNIFPSYCTQKAFRSIEELHVYDCASVEEIFQLTANEVHGEEVTMQLRSLIVWWLPKMKQVWSRDPQGFLHFSNLQSVQIEFCKSLERLFPFSIANYLRQLENLSLSSCGMEEIVTRKDGPPEGAAIFELNHLSSLKLQYLHKLKGFYGGVHTLECRSLKRLHVHGCKKLKLFSRESNRCQESSPTDQLHLSLLQPLFIIEEVIGNLEELTVDYVNANMILQQQFSLDLFCKLKSLSITYFEDDKAAFPHRFLQNIPNLEKLQVKWSSFKEIFYDETPPSRQGGCSTRLQSLSLMGLPKLRHICKDGCQIHPILEAIKVIYVANCSTLRNLVPSSVTFRHLTYLTIRDSNGLINLISSSTARSLVKLRTMKIEKCNSLEEVVKEEMNETDSEIKFSSLTTIELECLPKLNSFSSSKCFLKFPLLETVVVSYCPRMKIFAQKTSTPMLKKVLIETEEREEWRWEGDINRTIKKMFLIKDAFRGLKHLELSKFPELKDLWYDKFEHKIFCNLKSLKVQKCDFLSNFLFSSNLLRELSNLEDLGVRDCGSLEAIFDLNDMNEREIPVEETVPLKKITLSNLPKLMYIWKQDSPNIVSFDNSGGDDAGECQKLKISEASVIEKTREEDKVDTRYQQPLFLAKKVRFSKLETMRMKDMENLKMIWHPTLTPNSLGGFKTLEVENCVKLDNIIPSHMLRICATLETLVVRNCNSVEVIFQLNANEIHSEEDMAHLKKLSLHHLPKLKLIWTRDPQRIFRFHNLQVLIVKFCSKLEYLFPFSIATDLLYLEKLEVSKCGIKEIVANKEGATTGTANFVFSHLKSLDLVNLHKLERFYEGNFTLVCQSLTAINVFNSNKLELFKSQSASSIEIVASDEEKSIGTWLSMLEPLFTVEEVIPNLEKLTLNQKAATMILKGQYSGEIFTKLKLLQVSKFEYEPITFPDWFLVNVPSLESLTVKWSSFKEVFQDERLACTDEGKNRTSTRLKRLTLLGLPKLQHICKEGSQIDPVLKVLQTICVKQCPSLVHMVPCYVTFGRLTYLEVQNCNGLIDLIASSTARSLVKLTTMMIKECNSLEQIVTEEVDMIEDEISFSSLEVLELACLPRLNRFCSSKCLLKFPLLEKVVVKQCPRMEIFSIRETSTPNLRKIQVEETEEEWFWEGDLNSTINRMFLDKVAFGSFKPLNLSEYPELKDLWYSQVGNKTFCNLKSLVVHQCNFLSDILFSSNLLRVLHSLEELKVSDCVSLEAVFDVKVTDDKETDIKKTSWLKKLNLSGLPNLKHIWKKDPRQILGFENLKAVEVIKCQNLMNLFPLSLCHDLVHLEELHIEDCGVEEIVATEEVSELLRFDFPQLTILRLLRLTKLKNFYSGRHILVCPLLKTLNVSCEALQIFGFDHSDSQEKHRVDEVDMPIQQVLFNIEKVSPNLEELTLNCSDAMRILNGHCEAHLFHSVQKLRLQCFQETPTVFLNDFLKRFPKATTLQVRYSSFKVLFPSDGLDCCSITSPSQMETLWLYKLQQLEHIWNDKSVSDFLAQKLEHLSIRECSNLLCLAPPSISFFNLTTLRVEDCEGLKYLITSSTAKSLVHLRTLKVKTCEMIEDIVMTDEGESEEIIFESLKSLHLSSLPNFKCFCSGKHTFIFASLMYLIVKECPKMQGFSRGVIIAPFLTGVEVENEKKQLKEGLNTTIKQLFLDKNKEVPEVKQEL